MQNPTIHMKESNEREGGFTLENSEITDFAKNNHTANNIKRT